MSDPLSHPAFGAADLTNCERELIHLAGSIQPHGVLLVIDEATMTIQQLSANAASMFGDSARDRSVDALFGSRLDVVSPELDAAIRPLLAGDALNRPAPFRCQLPGNDALTLDIEGMVHHSPLQGGVRGARVGRDAPC